MTDFNLIDVIDLLKQANDQGINVSFEEGELLVHTFDTAAIEESFLDKLREKKEHFIEYFVNHQRQPTTVPAVGKASTIGSYPLSFGQERLWITDRLEGSIQYHIPVVLRLNGNFNREALEYALQQIINRHEVLRTTIREQEEAGTPYQYILPKDQWQLTTIETELYKDNPAALRALITQLIRQPFDLSADHMLRAQVINIHATEHILVITVHHIAADGWSVGIIIDELTTLYNAFGHTDIHQLPELPLQYVDYAVWQRNYMTAELLENKMDYWKRKLQELTPLEIPTDYSRPPVQQLHGATAYFRIDKELTTRLNQLSQQQGVTLFMTLLAAFKVLLFRYSGQPDICVGSPVAGRMLQQEIEQLVGFFVNTLALRSNLDNNPSFTALLQQIKMTTLEAYQHQEVPFEKIVDRVATKRDVSRSPVFQVMFVLQNTPEQSDLQLGEVKLSVEAFEQANAQYDITMSVEEDREGMHVSMQYSTGLFRESTIRRMGDHFSRLLQTIVQSPGQHIGTLQFLSEEEQQQLLVSFNKTIDFDVPAANETIVSVFTKQAALLPDHTAVECKDTLLTYRELDIKSNQLAHYLRNQGVTRETLVPLCMERSAEMLIAILGILKAGGAYVPVDPDYPQPRISYILENTRAAVMVCSNACMNRIPVITGMHVIVPEDDRLSISRQRRTPVKDTPSADQLAYIIYTSGSTGRPKGVMIEHRNVVNLAASQKKILELSAGTGFLQFASLGFDASCYEIFNTLLSGGRLIVPEKEDLLSAESFGTLLAKYIVDIVALPPSYLHMVREYIGPVKIVVSAGEALNREDAKYIQSLGIRMINGYGPTENTVCATITDQPFRENNTVVIGGPRPHVQIYILDTFGNLCPVGVPGEITIAGAGLARGYLNSPDTTAEKFIPNPFSHSPGERLYKSGDIGRWLPDGSIEYLGRIDDQVKIRGYRIELGEIESVLQECPLVAAAVVLAKTSSDGNPLYKQLVGYIVPQGDFNRDGILAYLRQVLPEYMTPTLLVPLEQLPVTANGKIDKKALSALEALTAQQEYVAPRNETEQLLVGIWQDLLNVQRVGIYDNFFELGGDSIVTIQIVSRVKRAGYELYPKDLFIRQDIAGVATLITGRSTSQLSAEQGFLTGDTGLLPIQQWYLSEREGVSSHFNQQVLLEVNKAVSTEIIANAMEHLLSHHDALRFVYGIKSNNWEQWYGTWKGVPDVVDLRSLSANDVPAAVEAHANKFQQGLSITDGILVRFVILLTPDTVHANRLLIIIHHLAIDGVSWRILLEDLEFLTDSLSAGTVPSLGNKTSAYREWYNALVQYGQQPRVLQQREYWRNIVQQYVPLRLDQQYDASLKISDLQNHRVRLNTTFTRQLLQEASRAYHTEVNDLLLCALALALNGKLSDQQLVIGLEGHGREDIMTGLDTSHTIGWFTNMYPLLLETKPGEPNGWQLREVKEHIRRIPDKGMGYGVLKYCNKEASLQGKDPWDIVFNYLGQSDNVVNSSKWFALGKEPTGTNIDDTFIVNFKLSVTGIIANGELLLDWSYSKHHYHAATIATLAEDYIAQLESLITHCVQQQQPIATPADYGLQEAVTNAELDRFLDALLPAGMPARTALSGISRLTGLQNGMLFHSLYETDAASYMQQLNFSLTDVDTTIFTQSWQHLVDRHSILRTGFFHDVFVVPVQCTCKNIAVPLTIQDYRNSNVAEQEKAIRRLEEEERNRKFNLKDAPLMRIVLVRLNDTLYHMVWTFHHILLDGWSVPLLIEELLRTYEALVTGQSLPVAADDNYEDYIHYLERRNVAQEESYWRTYLKNVSGSTLLPFIGTTAERTKGKGEYRSISLLPGEKSAQVIAWAQQHHLTVNTVMQAVWAYLLYRYTGNNNVLFGVTVAGRPDELPDIEHRVGMYINTQPLHAAIDEQMEIGQWLQQIQEQQLQNREYQYTTLNDIQRWIDVQGDLFDSFLAFENYPVSKTLAAQPWKLQIAGVKGYDHSNYPLGITVGVTDEISISFKYNSTLLDDHYVQRLRDHFARVLYQITDNTVSTLADLTILTAEEQTELLISFNNTTVVHPADKTIPDLFAAQVAAVPEMPAVMFQGHALTYQELDLQAGQLATYLKRYGVKEGVIVPLCMEKSSDMIIGILGIIKAGGTYLPVDPDYPAERIAYILRDTGATLAICNNGSEPALQQSSHPLRMINLDNAAAIIATQPALAATELNPASLAYIIYTSGSTGTPKGVMIEHHGLTNLVCSQCRVFGLRPGTRMVQFASVSFDASCSEIFNALASGTTLVIPEKEDIQTAEALLTFLERNEVEVATLPPSYLHVVKQHLGKLKTIISAGEALNAEDAKYIQSLGIRLINAYGPTENTVCVTMSEEQVVLPSGIVTIGRPIDNVKVYIVDKQLNPVPLGVAGELCVGGAQVARGYLNRPELTAEKFIKDPFSRDATARLYKTGDLARWLPDGNIEYAGRIDQQVKIAGHRIERGEIEAVLNTYPHIENAVVLLNGQPDNKKLVAFYTERNKVELWPSIAEFFIYDDIVYRSMYEHSSRNAGYRAAIQKVVKDKVVLEIGPGPEAVLSRLCIDCGAKHIYAVEILEETYEKAKKCITALGLTDKITLIHGDIREVALPEKADYCVSEIVGSIGGSEGSAVLINAAKKFLHNPSHMIPSRSATMIAAVTLDESLFEYGFSDIAYHYVERIAMEFGAEFAFRLCLKNLPTQHIISSKDLFEDLNYREESAPDHTHAVTLTITRDTVFNGFYVWMDLFMDEEHHLDISEDTGSWLPIYFPVAYPGYQVQKGDTIQVNISRKLSSNNVNPDYFIKGWLHSAVSGKIAISFDSWHHQHVPSENTFYKKLFNDGAIRLLPGKTPSHIRQHLSDYLPQYMIPAAFIPVTHIPLTINGKIDQKELLKQYVTQADASEYTAPETPMETALAAIWQEILGVERLSIKDDFFKLGGDSILIITLVSRLRNTFNLEIELYEVYQSPTLEEIAALITRKLAVIKEEDPTGKAVLDEIAALKDDILKTIPDAALIEDIYPMSDIQKGMVYASLVNPELAIYHDQMGYMLPPDIDAALFEKALLLVTRKHEMLRTTFNPDLHEEGIQIVFREVPVKPDYLDLSALDEPAAKTAIEAYYKKERGRPFKIGKEPLWRASLIKLQRHTIFLFQCHHAIIDGWSDASLMTELNNVYLKLKSEPSLPALPRLKASYKDHIIENMIEKKRGENKVFWKEELATYKRLDVFSEKPIRKRFVKIYEEAFLEELRQRTSNDGITLKGLCLGAFVYAMSMLTYEDELTIGLVSNTRPVKEDGDKILGCFLNTIPFRFKPEQHTRTWKTYFEEMEEKLLTLKRRDRTSLFEITKITGEQFSGENPYFDILFNFVNFHIYDKLEKGVVEEVSETTLGSVLNYGTNNTFLSCIASVTSNIFEISYAIRKQFKSEKSLEELHQYFDAVIHCYLHHYQEPVNRQQVMPEQEQQLLSAASVHRLPAPATHQTWVDLLTEQAFKSPGAIAVMCEGQTLTYGELHERSNQLAHYLKQKGVKPGTLVPLCMQRTPDMMISLTGILKAGAAYVPIDPDFPASRISYIITDTHAKVAITDHTCMEKFTGTDIQEIIVPEHSRKEMAGYPAATPPEKPSLQNLVYIIYTSGSTGTPKGVMITHANLMDYLLGLYASLPLKDCHTFGLMSGIATDLGNTVLFSALAGGGTLHLLSKEMTSDIDQVQAYFSHYKIDCIKIVPSHWKTLSLPGQLLLPEKLLIFGGELLEAATIEQLRAAGASCNIVNHYGPTETTVGKLMHPVSEAAVYEESIPVGKPFSDTYIRVLGATGQLSPVGVPGELYIGGAGVAPGYWNNPALTAERFVDDPFVPMKTSKLYRTGDMVKYLPDGNIVFIGRADEQVKIRGYRVEPGEIDRILNQAPQVKQAVVVAWSANNDLQNKQLIAYIIPDENYKEATVTDFLKQQLPEYMLPSILITVDRFPLMANGKIDRKALPAPDGLRSSDKSFAAPGTAIEKELAAIWSSLMKIETPGLHDDFFSMGGDSLLAIRLISAVRKKLQADVSIGDVFEHPTIAAFAQQITIRGGNGVNTVITRQKRPERIPLSFSQERLWFIDQLGGSLHYHVPAILRLKGTLNREALSDALQTIISRHEMLRTVIATEDGKAWQHIKEAGDWTLTVIDDPLYKAGEEQLSALITSLIATPFDLSADYMLRAHLVVLQEDEHLLVAVLHHIASDGWSTGIIIHELAELYNAAELKRPPLLPAMEIQYADYALWQRGYLSGQVLEDQLNYWKHKLEDTTPLNLPVDFPRSGAQSFNGEMATFLLDKTLSDALQQLSLEQDVTLFMTLLTAFKILLYRYTGQEDIAVGTPVAGRTRQELEGLIGFFINTLVLRSDLSNHPSFTMLLQQVKQTTIDAYKNQDIPFEKIVDAVVKDRDPGRSPLFQVLFGLHNLPDAPALNLGGLQLFAETPEHTTSKFDMTFSVTAGPDGLHIGVEYCRDLFTAATIRNMVAHYENLLRGIVSAKNQGIDSLPLLSAAEHRRLTIDFNNTATQLPDKTTLDCFVRQAALTPDNNAIITANETLTYRQLHEQSNRLAHYLVMQGVKPDGLIPVCIEKSDSMLVAMLGIWKAGGAFVPIDPDFPQERINYLLQDCNSNIVVSSSHCKNSVAAGETHHLLLLDEDRGLLNNMPADDLPPLVNPHHLAYVIYTSGSSGVPKGVMVEHGNLINYLQNSKTRYINENTSYIGSFIHLSYTFDAALTALFMPLIAGKAIVIGGQQSAAVFEEELFYRHAPYDFIKLTPAHMQLLEQAMLRHEGTLITNKLVLGGEALQWHHLAFLAAHKQEMEVINEYGPTEATVGCTVYSLNTRDNHPVNSNGILIGQPIDNVQIYILDASLNPVPAGVPGEICIGGEGVARGYLNAPERTQEKFIPDPFSSNGGRLYRTGDTGRWMPDGNIAYIGRTDDQLKIKGYRVEPGEIENALNKLTLVTQAVVMAKTDRHHHKSLVAYIQPTGQFDREAIITDLKKILPDYMIPSTLINVAAFPLTSHGKIDRNALPAPENEGSKQDGFVAPRNETESKMQDIWLQLLEITQVGVYDDFFNAGGDSLLAVRLVAHIRKTFDTDISIGRVFELKTIAQLADYILLVNASNEAGGESGFETVEL